MEAQTIQEYERLERDYWWFVGRRRILESVLKKYFSSHNLHILDWGCGPGANFPLLQTYGEVTGVDASDEAISACKAKGIKCVMQAENLAEFGSNERFDLITNFDVLEHIEEDEQFLADIKSKLVPSGYILLTVPAYQFLWTGFDELVGHKRRYTKRELCKKFERSGYQIIMTSYFNFFLSPAFVLVRLFQKLQKKRSKSFVHFAPRVPRPINWLFAQILFLEALIISRIHLPFGTSLMVLARQHALESIASGKIFDHNSQDLKSIGNRF